MRREDFKRLNGNKKSNFTYQEMHDFFVSKGFTTWGAHLQILRVSYAAMKKLQKFRTLIKRPVYFNSITEGGHVKGSIHFLGKAFDIRIGGKGAINWNNMIQCAIEAGFKGIGYYPNWKPNRGLHLDDRSGLFKIWKRIKVKGKKVYRGLI